MKKKLFVVGDAVRVARGPFKDATGVVTELCDDPDWVVARFDKVKIRIFGNLLVLTDPEPVTTTKVKKKKKKTLIQSSHHKKP